MLLGVPIKAGPLTVGALVFFSTRTIEPDLKLRETMNTVTTLLSRVIERERFEREIADLTARERNRIAEELHDEVGQELAAIALTADRLSARLAKSGSDERESMDELAAGIHQALHGVRAAARDLLRTAITGDQFLSSLQDLSSVTGKRWGIEIRLEADPELRVDDDTTATHLHRIAQEAIANAARHARASEVIVSIREDGGGVVLEIRDNGAGMPPMDGVSSGMGIGFMHRRARLIGGFLEIFSPPVGGTIVRCTVPPRSRRGASAGRI
jgi:signal transduction histidine kinase